MLVLVSIPVEAQEFAYVANSTPGNILGYRVNTGTGALTPMPGSPFVAGSGTNSIALTPDRRFLYVTNGNGANLAGFSIDSVSGVLTPVPTSPFFSV